MSAGDGSQSILHQEGEGQYYILQKELAFQPFSIIVKKVNEHLKY